MSKIDSFILDTLNKQYNYLDKPRNIKDYVRYMFNRSFAMFEYSGLPDTIPQIELEKILQIGGFGIWAKVNNDLYVFSGGLGGEQDVYYRPTIATVSNPALNISKNFIIDKECIVMPNDSMFMGLFPLFNRYCNMLNENDISMLLYDVNKRASFILSAQDDNTADSARDFLQKLFNGEQAVITDKNIIGAFKAENANTGNSTGIKDLIEYQQYLKASLYNEIGLNSNFNMKRERLNTSEVEMNSGNLYPLVDDMLNSRKNALEKINEMFGTNINIEFASSWKMRATDFEQAATEEQESGTEGTESAENAGQVETQTGQESGTEGTESGTENEQAAQDESDTEKEGENDE